MKNTVKSTARRVLVAAALTGAAVASASGAAQAASFQPADVQASGLDTSLTTASLPGHEMVQDVQMAAARTAVGLMFGDEMASRI